MSKHTPLVSKGSFSPVAAMPAFPASVVKNKFAEVMRRAVQEPVAVTRHDRREFVLLTAEHYEELRQSRRSPLAAMESEYDRMVESMNTPEAKQATKSLFSANSKALGNAAVKARRTSHA